MDRFKPFFCIIALLVLASPGLAWISGEIEWDDGELEIEIDHVHLWHPHAIVASAPPLDAEPTYLELRSGIGSWESNISAGSTDPIDIRMNVQLLLRDGYRLGSSSFSPVEAFAVVYGKRLDGRWVQVTKTNTVTLSISALENKVFSWPRAFSTSAQFVQYRVVGFAAAPGEVFGENASAYIDSIRATGRCEQIQVAPVSFELGENSTRSFSLRLENTSDALFYVDSLSIIENAPFLSVRTIDNSFSVAPYATRNPQFEATAGEVFQNYAVDGTVRVSGHFDNGVYCSFLETGETQITINVKNSQVLADSCNQLVVNVFPIEIPEDASTTKTFFVQNNSSKRFFINSVEVSDDSETFFAQKEYFDPIIPSRGTGEVRLKFSSQSVSTTRTGNASIRVSGEFEGGPVCSGTVIGPRTFSVTVVNQAPTPTCSKLSIRGDSIIITENASKSQSFYVVNDSDDDFLISDIRLNESDPDFAVQLVSSESKAPAGGKALIQIRATTGTFGANKNTKFEIEVRGEFENGTVCSFADVDKEIQVELVKSVPDNNPAICKAVSIDSHPVMVQGGSTISDYFFVKNNASKTFFIDSLRVFDESEAVFVHETVFDAFALSGDKAKVFFGVSGQRVSSPQTTTGFAQVSGHFSDGSTCSFNAIGTFPFPIIVNPTIEENNCPDFRLDIPAQVKAGSNNRATVEFTIHNPTPFIARVHLSGAHLTVSPTVIEVGPRSSFSTEVVATLLSDQSANLEYRVAVDGCTIPVRYTKIIFEEDEEEEPEEDTDDVSILSAPAQIVFVNKTTIFAVLKNHADQSRSVVVSLENIPDQWQAEELALTLGPNETREVALNVYSNGFFTETEAVLRVEKNGVLQDDEKILLISVPKLSALTVLRVDVNVVPISQTETRVNVHLTNISQEHLTGSVLLALPPNWSVGNNAAQFSLEPGESITGVFSAVPGTNAKDENATVLVALEDGRSAEIGFLLKRFTGTTPGGGLFGFLGLFSLSGGAVSTGLMIVLIVLAVLVIFLFLDNQYKQTNPPRFMSPPFAVIESKNHFRSTGKKSWKA